jgi:hypothetical protein
MFFQVNLTLSLRWLTEGSRQEEGKGHGEGDGNGIICFFCH